MFLGVPLLDGGTVRLPQYVGLSRAMDMILTGRPVDAKEAYSIGKHVVLTLFYSVQKLMFSIFRTG